MTKLENTYCRKPGFRMFSELEPGKCMVESRPNVIVRGRAVYDRGIPDLSLAYRGRRVEVECKADLGSLFLGDPAKPDVTKGLHAAQRDWYLRWKDAIDSYWILLWMYPSRNKKEKKYHKKAKMYLLPQEEWITLEKRSITETGKKTVPLSRDQIRGSKDSVTVDEQFRRFSLEFSGGKWIIPDTHPFTERAKTWQN